MSDTDTHVPLPDLNAPDTPVVDDIGYHDDEQISRVAADLEAVFDVPVQDAGALGRSKMDVGELLKLGPGTVLELDRRVGEAPHCPAIRHLLRLEGELLFGVNLVV